MNILHESDGISDRIRKDKISSVVGQVFLFSTRRRREKNAFQPIKQTRLHDGVCT